MAEYKSKLRSPLLLGQLIIWGIITLTSFFIAFLLRYTSFESVQVPMLAYATNFVSLLLGGFISGRFARAKGWLYGGIQGIIYALLLVIIGFLAFDTSLIINPLLFTICAFGLSAIGGIVGVNTTK
ncbi:TIGR04086 family membrane protein [Hazenella sp. IB182357]|uniref:TIGR04086 family membrane protein n=1 Tax=Polycladospora coralii TaxID=2771432 RepID=A0A926N8H3_9BACL|nr:TIGR04086 family membrane protein [Polycladospora coralii]MBD1371722.1 TIGR04086 family membrane protein [Polycladospora coralii]MBS7529189.1 TIGR04086 family membrane protein [Polycladospora coralii]